jgi:DNA-binding transcriptional ArsR family regulator
MSVVQSLGMGISTTAPAETVAETRGAHPGREELELTSVLHALSDPMRLRIVVELASGEERTCNSFGLPVVKSTRTHHLRVLRAAGVIRQRSIGTTRLNRLRRDDLEARFPGLIDVVLSARR